MAKSRLTYSDPIQAVLLRRLAWETYIAKPVAKLKAGDITEDLINAARRELGLKQITRGPASDLYNKLASGRNPVIKKKPFPMPAEKEWATAWRLLRLPSHLFVRELSEKPIIVAENTKGKGFDELRITLRNPALPQLRVFIGIKKPKGDVFSQRRGVYFLRLPDKLYIGKSDEFDIRLAQHKRGKHRSACWWIFVTPQVETDDKTFTLDALAASEALLISFWNEVCKLGNDKRGADQEPGAAYLQQAILLVAAASATLVWLMREKTRSGVLVKLKPWDLPFKAKGPKKRECYLQPSTESGKNE
jgi:hypothetical protein